MLMWLGEGIRWPVHKTQKKKKKKKLSKIY